ncbi:fluoride efflux transporter CrcB [Flavobacteriaceae bacterium]|nr:fluoride efflux transporter CrcB [Flavobacteriaceae bacterium]
MQNILIVACGGALGSVLRFVIYEISKFFYKDSFFFPTVFVNVLGCFVMGIIYCFSLQNFSMSEAAKIFLITGFLGGFTTFSSFSLDAFKFFNSGQHFVAFSYIFLSVLFSLLFFFCGFFVAKLISV